MIKIRNREGETRMISHAIEGHIRSRFPNVSHIEIDLPYQAVIVDGMDGGWVEEYWIPGHEIAPLQWEDSVGLSPLPK